MTTKKLPAAPRTVTMSETGLVFDAQPDLKLNNNRLFLMLWFVVEGMLFGSLIFSNFSVRSAQGDWPPPGVDRMDMRLPLLFTAALLISSFTAIQAINALKRDDRGALVRFLGATVVLGLAFVFGMVNLISHLQFTGVYSAMFVAMWGMHVAHAVAVLLFLGYVLWRASQGRYTSNSYWSLEAATNLWHFLDVVWIVLFVVLYLV